MKNQGRIYQLLLLEALILLLCTTTTRAVCPLVSGKLRGLEHNVAGAISISKNCTLSIENFSYDGKAPQVYFWGAKECGVEMLRRGGRLSDVHLMKSFENEQLSVPLLQDINWSNIGCISVYCEEFYADLGDLSFTPVDVKQTTVPSNDLPLSSPPPPAEFESVEMLSSCTELIPGYFNLHWQIDNATKALVIGLEGRPGTADSWLGFGFSAPNATGPEMIGSNVVVAGMVKGECFAYPYFLSAQSQCDFANADGVCPDFAGQEPLQPTKLIDVLSCKKEGDKLSILMKWPLGPSSNGKNNINVLPTDGSLFSIYAMGPLSEGSNATVPVVLYHNLKLPGTAASASITANRDMPLKINFSAVPDNNCRTIVPSNTSSTSTTAAVGGTVATIDGPTTFNITIGSNKNYPNPPAWGYSLWVNNQESPVVIVRRGTPYKFNIAAGPTHPVYITSSIIGGGLLVDFKDETVFAGNETTVGTPGKSHSTFVWTPDAKTPDIVYYQCVVHQKLGWEIKVLDAGAPMETSAAAAPSRSTAPDSAPAPAPAPSENSSLAKARCTIAINGKSNLYNACIPLTGVGKNFNMAWNLDSSELAMGFNATSNGWVAIGFPQTYGQMVGSSAIVLKTCGTCPSGAEIAEYYLGAQTVSGVQQASNLNATELEASFKDGMLSGKFKIKLLASDNTVQSLHHHRRRSLLALDSAPSNFPLIFAAGDLSSNSGTLQQHSTFGSTSVDVSIGKVTQGDGSSSIGLSAPVIDVTSTNATARTAHMWLMVIGFGILIPIGIVLARFWSPPNSSKGFNLHRAVQTLGFVLGVAGIACGFIASGGWTSKYAVHRNIGMAVIVLCFVQILALVWRPKLEDTLRRPWAFGHRWMGRIVAILAIANIYYGIIHVAVLGTWAWATYTAILGALFLVGIGKECFEYTQGKQRSAGVTIENFEKEKSVGSSFSSLNHLREV